MLQDSRLTSALSIVQHAAVQPAPALLQSQALLAALQVVKQHVLAQMHLRDASERTDTAACGADNTGEPRTSGPAQQQQQGLEALSAVQWRLIEEHPLLRLERGHHDSIGSSACNSLSGMHQRSAHDLAVEPTRAGFADAGHVHQAAAERGSPGLGGLQCSEGGTDIGARVPSNVDQVASISDARVPPATVPDENIATRRCEGAALQVQAAIHNKDKLAQARALSRYLQLIDPQVWPQGAHERAPSL